MKNEKITYTEPISYFSEATRRKFKLGEFAEDENEQKDEKEQANKEIRDFVNRK